MGASQTTPGVLQVLVNGALVSLSNYISTVIKPGAVYAPLCRSEGNGVGDGSRQLAAGQPTEFNIQTFDVFGNARTEGGVLFDSVVASARYALVGETNASSARGWEPDGRYFIRPSAPVDNADGSLTVTYTPQASAYYLVEVRRSREKLQYCPPRDPRFFRRSREEWRHRAGRVQRLCLRHRHA